MTRQGVFGVFWYFLPWARGETFILFLRRLAVGELKNHCGVLSLAREGENHSNFWSLKWYRATFGEKNRAALAVTYSPNCAFAAGSLSTTDHTYL